MTVKARVHIAFRNGVHDPQGRAIAHALGSLGFEGVNDVRQGKVIDIDLHETDRERAHKAVDAMCKALLANPVIETYTIELL